ncbi:MAG: hypothetical protein AABX24_02230, partial [Nanoarchaeota archaeon]
MVSSKNVLNLLFPVFAGVATAAFSTPALAQRNDPSPTYIGKIDPAARLAVLGTNVGLNGIICGITAAVERRNVLKDTGQCMAAGTIQYMGMEMGMHDAPVLPGIGLRVVETGTSIIDNTLAGREPFERLHYEFGPALFQIDLKNKGLDTYWRISPAAGIIYNTARGNELNLFETFSYQTFIFNKDTDANALNPDVGLTIGNIIFYDPKYPDIKAHEFNHVLQYVRFRPAQLLVPEPLSFLEDTLHYRAGEDVANVLFYGIGKIGCAAIDDVPSCERRWWNLLEAESYTMQTAYEKHQ